ncbi:MAG: Protein containing Hedgehog/intein hint domain, C-terminal domain, partial [Microgenomates group bacterium Gr01-1014_7]
PLQALHVVGQCVAKGTRIRRRRKNKKGEWEEVPVEDIRPDDEILSLNDQTGKWEWNKVEKTMDMGIQAVFRLETESGKWIETTGNHPYLVKIQNSLQKTALADGSPDTSGLTRFANTNEPDLRIDINIPQNSDNVNNQKGVDPTGIEPVRPEFLDPVPEPGGPTQGLLSQNTDLFSIKWVKVSQLKLGQYIATQDGWEKIVNIDNAGRKQTYDLQISNTHNFLANNIVAHNTYINSGLNIGAAFTGGAATISNGLAVSGNVGIGTTTANSTLSVAGSAHIGGIRQGIAAPANGLFVDGNVGIGATTSNNLLDVWGNARITGTLGVDSTGTLGAGLIGYLGVTAPTSGLAVSGNVGIGTTSPLQALHVVGQCVAKGTRIRRRRKNKKGEWEEVPYINLKQKEVNG